MSDDLSGQLLSANRGKALFERLYKEEVAKNEILQEEMECLRDQGGLPQRYEVLQEEHNRLRETHDALQAKHSAMLEKAVISSNAEVVAAMTNIHESMKDGKEASAKVQALTALVSLRTGEVESMEKEFEALKKNHFHELLAVREELDRRSAQFEEASVSLVALRERCTVLSAEATDHQRVITDLRASLDEKTKECTQFRMEVKRALPTTETIEKSSADMIPPQQLSDLRFTIEKRDKEIERLKDKILSVTHDLVKEKQTNTMQMVTRDMKEVQRGLKEHVTRAQLGTDSEALVDTMCKVLSGHGDIPSLMVAWKLHCETVVQRQQDVHSAEVARILNEEEKKKRDLVRDFHDKLSILTIERDRLLEESSRLSALARRTSSVTQPSAAQPSVVQPRTPQPVATSNKSDIKSPEVPTQRPSVTQPSATQPSVAQPRTPQTVRTSLENSSFSALTPQQQLHTDQWVCRHCTLLNERSAMKCAVCERTKLDL